MDHVATISCLRTGDEDDNDICQESTLLEKQGRKVFLERVIETQEIINI